MAKQKKTKEAEKENEVEPTLEDLENEELEDDVKESDTESAPESDSTVETESLEARVESEKKKAEPENEAEGTFMSVDAAEERNVKASDLTLETNAMGIQGDEFICSKCFLILNKVQLAKPRAKVCIDCT